MTDEDRDYITVNPAVRYAKFNVVVMKWDQHERQHSIFRISHSMPKAGAEALAKSWAAAMRLEIR